jgi:hypothetical protein
MADTKISALTASTTPLAGTEVLPIVQGGVTKQVSVANLTAGRAVSVASLTASTGNIVIGTSGQGIDFSATPGTGTSELLADYEEGTWTPAYAPTSGAFTSISYGFRSGQYFKIGNMVYVSWRMRTSALSVGTGSGTVLITGLPFAAGAISVELALGVGDSFAVNNAGSGRVSSNAITLLRLLNNLPIDVTDLSTGSANNFTAGFVCYSVV